ncbi:MAG: SemiSWEET transporter [Thermodesulfovibrio sp.]|nr:SemiSWEET transporter [Thermodesulfovibrio sp.]MCX7724816.1 SemiSWEET transporter [Thermodesulfovibrio sp.]MDW7971651.1 SemiSWEET transporter [Thermodesulfovibrio sp.]
MEFSIDFSNIIGIIAGAITTSALIPQVLKIYKTKSAKDISLTMFIFMAVGISLWLLYGFLIEEFPVILANTVSLFLIGLIIIMKIRYG